MSDVKRVKKTKEIESEADSRIKEIKQQLGDQLKCLDQRLEYQIQLLGELQEFYRRRADIELEYARQLDRLHRSYKPRKEERNKEFWRFLAPWDCWESVIKSVEKQYRFHSKLYGIYTNNISNRLADLENDVQSLQKRCRDMGAKAHEQILKCLNELQSSLKVYNYTQQNFKSAEVKLESVKKEKLKSSSSKKSSKLAKTTEKKERKYSEQRKAAIRARNEYMLCVEAANAAIKRFYVSDIYDLIDTMDHGYHASLRNIFLLHVSSGEQACQQQMVCNEELKKRATEIDTQKELQVLKDNFRPIFAVPPPFEFQRHIDDDLSTGIAQADDDLIERAKSLRERIDSLKLCTEEKWKTLEATEHSLSKIFVDDVDQEATDVLGDNAELVAKQSCNYQKRRNDRLEQEEFYLKRLEEYLININLMARLEAKHAYLQKAVGEKTPSQAPFKELPPKPKSRPFRKSIFNNKPLKLFGGTIEEYVEAVGDDIPLVIRSCIRVIVKFGLHHQGIFRVPGAQLEINEFRNAFERGEDPLADVTDGKDINSVAGVLKLYIRELREALFPPILFDQLISCSKSADIIPQLHDLLTTALPRPVLVVMRYLFAFFSHLSEYSDENMMDPSNLAICLGPTLFPVPHDKDQVHFRGPVNELIKSIIIHHQAIFPQEGGELYNKFMMTVRDDTTDNVSDNDEEEANDLSVDDSTADRDSGWEVTALYDFTGRTSLELTFSKGSSLTVYNKASDEWWRGSFKGRKGLIPANYITRKSSLSADFRLSGDFKPVKAASAKLEGEEEENVSSSSTSSDVDSMDEPNIEEQLEAAEERRTPDLVLDLPKRNDGITSAAEAFACTQTGTIKKGHSVDSIEAKDDIEEELAEPAGAAKPVKVKPPIKAKPSLGKTKSLTPPDGGDESNV